MKIQASPSVLYLPELLQQPAQVFVVSLGAGGAGSTVLQLHLQLQQAAHVVRFLAGRLLQQRLLVGLSILCDLTLGGVGLAERLEEMERKELVMQMSLRHERNKHLLRTSDMSISINVKCSYSQTCRGVTLCFRSKIGCHIYQLYGQK